MNHLDRAREMVGAAANVVVFTGAGMSAESGVPTFRDALTGLWAHFDPAELATPEAWERDRSTVWSWYAERAAGVREVAPNDGHRAISRLADDKRADGGSVSIITQNVDDLHERAGGGDVCHLHGSLFAPRCDRCGRPASVETALDPALTACTACPGRIRPGVVWFGELLPADAWARAEEAFAAADLVLVVGTSGVVHPAAGLPESAARGGVPVLEVNPEPSELTGVRLRLPATAAEGLPRLVG
ncbi:NAD-dependent deacylase [Gordonia caeni]|uniref:NAD-dependent protein deacylase n=1 Tax=Gordonia caeni TaxID=1007097 RepID=A0ABP7PBQ2_9ACTN